MAFRKSSAEELAQLEQDTFKQVVAKLREISRKKGRPAAMRALGVLRMGLDTSKIFATVYSAPRWEAKQRGLSRAAREWQQPRRKRKRPQPKARQQRLFQ